MNLLSMKRAILLLSSVITLSVLPISPVYAEQDTKDLISLNFTEAETTKVLGIIAKFSGRGLILPDSDLGTTSIYVKKIPWSEALSGVAKSENLEITIEPNYIAVSRKNCK